MARKSSFQILLEELDNDTEKSLSSKCQTYLKDDSVNEENDLSSRGETISHKNTTIPSAETIVEEQDTQSSSIEICISVEDETSEDISKIAEIDTVMDLKQESLDGKILDKLEILQGLIANEKFLSNLIREQVIRQTEELKNQDFHVDKRSLECHRATLQKITRTLQES